MGRKVQIPIYSAPTQDRKPPDLKHQSWGTPRYYSVLWTICTLKTQKKVRKKRPTVTDRETVQGGLSSGGPTTLVRTYRIQQNPGSSSFHPPSILQGLSSQYSVHATLSTCIVYLLLGYWRSCHHTSSTYLPWPCPHPVAHPRPCPLVFRCRRRPTIFFFPSLESEHTYRFLTDEAVLLKHGQISFPSFAVIDIIPQHRTDLAIDSCPTLQPHTSPPVWCRTSRCWPELPLPPPPRRHRLSLHRFCAPLEVES